MTLIAMALLLPDLPLHVAELIVRNYPPGVDRREEDEGLNILLFAGVDLTYYKNPNDPESGMLWETWKRALMGCKSSPYQACQAMNVVEEMIRGNRKDKTNVFRWDYVRLNLPGMADYDPSKPWVSKVRISDGRIAVEFIHFVDDLRPSGPTKEECVKAMRRVASLLNYFGIQDAARKRRDVSQTPGAWTGTIVNTTGPGIYILVDDEKWNNAERSAFRRRL